MSRGLDPRSKHLGDDGNRVQLILLTVVFLITSCSPHPGSGEWVAAGENPRGFTRLVVQFDGKAEFYVQGREAESLRCFWQTSGERRIDLQCAGENASVEERVFQLDIAESGQAKLKESGDVIVRFSKTAQ